MLFIAIFQVITQKSIGLTIVYAQLQLQVLLYHVHSLYYGGVAQFVKAPI